MAYKRVLVEAAGAVVILSGTLFSINNARPSRPNSHTDLSSPLAIDTDVCKVAVVYIYLFVLNT